MTRHLSADNDAIGTFETCRYVRDLVSSLIGRNAAAIARNAKRARAFETREYNITSERPSDGMRRGSFMAAPISK